MQKNIFGKMLEKIQKAIEYSPPTNPDPFVLDEKRPYDSVPSRYQPETNEEINLFRLTAMIALGKRLVICIENMLKSFQAGDGITEIAKYKTEYKALGRQWEELSSIYYAYRQSQDSSELMVSTSLDENLKILKHMYHLPQNKDLVIREIEIGESASAAAMVVYLEGLVEGQKLDRFVLEPLMRTESKLYQNDAIGQLIKRTIPNGQVRRADNFKEIQDGVNVGDTILIVDGFGEAIIIETKGWEHRGVDSPKTEQTVRGSLAAFSENLRVNTGLVRSILRSSDLVTELIKVGKRGQLNCALMYLDSVANPPLTDEVRRRLEGIKTDYISDSSELVQFIEDFPAILFPQTLSTERPDRVAVHLAEGRIALILEGNPFVQILPVSFFSFFHSAEDFSVKSGIANFMRVIRLFGTLISVVLPPLYLAISNFHPEAMPTELLLAVAGSRDKVPFPAWFEVLMMEISFELVREAGIRIPGLLASTIGIVGAVILGQAAVAARIVSPIVVVIVAITGLASFSIPEYRMASAVRLIRFFLLIVSAMMGLFGLAVALLIITAVLCRLKSFGMPYMSPVVPRSIANYDVVLRGQVFNQEQRPDELGTKDKTKQPNISRIWTKKEP